MFRELQLTNFKNFRDATLELGPFTVLVGANASGKSNLRDAFRFLHGVGRGYDFGEILEGKYGEGGEHVWNGIRGGSSQISFTGKNQFGLSVGGYDYRYSIDVFSQSASGWNQEQSPPPPHLITEMLSAEGKPIYKVPTDQDIPANYLSVEINSSNGNLNRLHAGYRLPVLSQLRSGDLGEQIEASTRNSVRGFERELRSMRFLDLHPRALQKTSRANQTTLGDRGQNLASVLMNLCEDEHRKSNLVDWVETLMPMDAKDFEFDVAKHSNEVTLVLVEKDGTKTPMQSASDGTLRFLGLLALLFQDDPPQLLFIEEIETGLHPTRLDLLVNLIEQRTEQTETQVIATTHSPLLLQVLDQETLENAQLVYRTGDGPEAKICPLLDVPTAREVLAEPDQTVRELHSTGWFERIMAFSGEEPVGP